MKIPQFDKSIGIENRLVVAWDWRWEEGLGVKEHKGYNCGNENNVKLVYGGSCTTP